MDTPDALTSAAVGMQGVIESLLAVARASAHLPRAEFKLACEVLAWHFAGSPQSALATMVRQFPGHMRADASPVAMMNREGKPAKTRAGSRS